MNIGSFKFHSPDHCFIIAEAGMNHNGDYQKALQLIDCAIRAGADCVKFQMRHLSELYHDDTLSGNAGDLSTQYTLKLLKKFELTDAQYKELKKFLVNTLLGN